jgi:uncharacterized protein
MKGFGKKWEGIGKIEIKKVPVHLPKLGNEFLGYRLVQFSDIHMDSWMGRKDLDKVVDLVNRQEPDLVAITGDFVSHDPNKHAKDLAEALSRLESVDGVVGVMGNHDHWVDPEAVREIMVESGIIELSNIIYPIQRGQDSLYIAGIDDYIVRNDRLEQVLELLPEDGAAILLAHEPDFADISARCGRFGMQISGHSHGGQVNLPLIGPLYLPRYARKYTSGLYRINGMIQYTNRGVGKVHVPFRLNSPPEITVFTLLNEDSGDTRISQNR